MKVKDACECSRKSSAELEKDWVTPSAKKLHGEKRKWDAAERKNTLSMSRKDGFCSKTGGWLWYNLYVVWRL